VDNTYPQPEAVGLVIGRVVFDRLLPAALFGAITLPRVGSLAHLWAAPVDPGAQAWLGHVLIVGHAFLTLAFMAMLTTLFVIRRTPISQRAAPVAMITALGGTFIMWIALAQPTTTDDWRVLAVADALMSAGLVFCLYALGALRACFGLAPEARGLVTSGAYRWVRHPVYLGEFIVFFGALLPVLSPFTLGIFGLFCLLQARRAVLEEQVLSATFPEYAGYRLRTPALVPWVGLRRRQARFSLNW
jgi:protein-S-isoprenylcysteine O-methyltransferase Ste14